ncbi:MAG: hypothetical protein P8008_07010, partial [Gammaproteobacteria bacterium]
RRIESSGARLALASAVLAIVAAFWLTSEVLLERLDRSGLDAPARVQAFELGWPTALAQFACVAWLALVCLAGLRRRGRDWAYPATGFAATVLVAVHSTVDFSLQIPAVALLYSTILGVGVAQSYSSRRLESDS